MSPIAVRVARGGETIGLALLSAVRRRGIWRISKAGTYGEPFMLLHTDLDALDALNEAIGDTLKHLAGPWSLHLQDIWSPQQSERLVASLPHAALGQGLPSPVLDVGAEQSIATALSRNTRSATAKARNRVRADGLTTTSNWLVDPAEIARHIDRLADIRRRRDQMLGRGRSASDKTELPTFRDTIIAHAQAGRARVLLLQIEGVTAAYAVCLTNANEAWVYSNSMHPDFMRYSPGTLANAEVVRAALDDPTVASLNWGAGIQRYKMSGPVTVHHTTTVSAFSSPATQAYDSVIPRIRAGLAHVRTSNNPPG